MVFVLNFDEHGGLYDHVVPPQVVDDNVNPNPGPHPDYTRLGFRVPAIAMGPFAPKKVETAGPYEHCSILAMIEWRFGLRPLSQRDASTRRTDPANLAAALHLGGADPSVPAAIPNPKPPPPGACNSSAAVDTDDTWTPILKAAARAGWDLPAPDDPR